MAIASLCGNEYTHKYTYGAVCPSVPDTPAVRDVLARHPIRLVRQLGDGLVQAYNKGRGSNLVSLIAGFSKETDRAYHTVEQAYRVASYFDGSTPAKTRRDKLSFTHHQEFFTYIGALNPRNKLVEPIIQAASELLKRAETAGGAKTTNNKTGSKIKPMPVAEFRGELRKITGKKACPLNSSILTSLL